MKPGLIRRSIYNDPLLRKRRRAMKLKLAGISIMGCAVLTGLTYVVFFSSFFTIRDVRIHGLSAISVEEVHKKISDYLQIRKFKLLPLNRNTIFFNGQKLTTDLLRSYPELMSARIDAQLTHTLVAEFQERVAVGIWCTAGKCLYFDERGTAWGDAPESSGSLFTVVDDKRSGRTVIDMEFLVSIQHTIGWLKPMGIGIKRVELSDEMSRDFKVFTMRGFFLILNLDTSIQEQINNLKILMSQRPDDFSPQYIDLRIKGRLYYK